MNCLITIGIDASNIRSGGGLTHLTCLLSSSERVAEGCRFVVWGGTKTLDQLPSRPGIEKVYVSLLDKSLPIRMAWQRWLLPGCLRDKSCDVLFSPGGTLPSHSGVPTVVMSQNLLPFEPQEAQRFGVSFMGLKMKLLHVSQKRSFEQADGIIFLTGYARDKVLANLPAKPGQIKIIPHGIEERFFAEPRLVRSFSLSRPFRLLYVSIVDVYKHQWQVAEAVTALRNRGVPLEVDFIGPAYGPALTRLTATMKQLDPTGDFLHYRGPLPYERLHDAYREADGFVFASSCENLPSILLEAMAAGLPIACSNRGPMPEVLGDAGVYFDPERPKEIAEALLQLIEDNNLRWRLAEYAFKSAQSYSWEHCARDTFSFISQVASGIPPCSVTRP